MASGQKLADRSREAYGRSPIMWQIELMDQVTWCSTAMRTREAQRKAVSAPVSDHGEHRVRPADAPAPGDRDVGEHREVRHDDEEVEEYLFAVLLVALDHRLARRLGFAQRLDVGVLVGQGHRPGSRCHERGA